MNIPKRDRPELESIFNECYDKLIELGIPLLDRDKIELGIGNFLPCGCFGTCNTYINRNDGKVVTDHCRIHISKRWKQNESRIFVKEIMFHELLHTCQNAGDHYRGNFFRYTKMLREKLGINVLRMSDDYAAFDRPLLAKFECPLCGSSFEIHDEKNLFNDIYVYKQKYTGCRCGGRFVQMVFPPEEIMKQNHSEDVK